MFRRSPSCRRSAVIAGLTLGSDPKSALPNRARLSGPGTAQALPGRPPLDVVLCASGGEAAAWPFPSDHMSRYESGELDGEDEQSRRQPGNGSEPYVASNSGFIGVVGTRRRGPQEHSLIPRTLVEQPAAVRVACQGASVV